MARVAEVVAGFEEGRFDEKLAGLYGWESVPQQRARYGRAVRAFEERFGGDREVSVYSAPGRTELCGNHTDHQNGLVAAAAVDLDIIAVAAKNGDGVLRVRSAGFSYENEIELSNLAPVPEERDNSAALVRGVAAGVAGLGGVLGGLDVYTTSDVPRGSGLSSSAAFEVCLGAALNGEYNGGRLTPLQLARVGQGAENHYFGKPSGLMDQLACAVGGAVLMDFETPGEPRVEPCPFDPDAWGYALVITDTGGSHAGLTGEYAAIRREMEAVAACFGREVLRGVAPEEFFGRIGPLREQVGERALLRAVHFFEECRRVRAFAHAAKAGDVREALDILVEAGRSSYMYNQNAYSCQPGGRQEMALGLALSEHLLRGNGAWRLQGGGFAGAIQAFVPVARLGEYTEVMEDVFGKGACRMLRIRGAGACKVL